jgi:radical SAM superfamily enzyme YgiQ (UPF0313 family)
MELLKDIYLFDLPTYPKGVVSLSLPLVAAYLQKDFNPHIIDLNFYPPGYYQQVRFSPGTIMFGLKVSSQNINEAKTLSQWLRDKYPGTKIVWGGELPSLLPEMCLEHADSVVQSMFDNVANEFNADLKEDRLKKIYYAGNIEPFKEAETPLFSKLQDIGKYYKFMGLPLETSRGCTETCTFCMVHVMQKKNYVTKSIGQITQELKSFKGTFVNLVDYNLGVSKPHVIEVANAIKISGATGWMGEMCIEMLDDDAVLNALAESGCRMIYCGLESIEQQGLNSIHKMNTNHIENYERIIKKAQSYGVGIASGFILGLPGTTPQTFNAALEFFTRVKIAYLKFTFITYNPGTKVSDYMKKKGTFVAADISEYDGNHLSFVPDGVEPEVVYRGAREMITKFYSLACIIRRSAYVRGRRRLEIILFNLCYRKVYLDWLNYNVTGYPGGIKKLKDKQFRKSMEVRAYEILLNILRK